MLSLNELLKDIEAGVEAITPEQIRDIAQTLPPELHAEISDGATLLGVASPALQRVVTAHQLVHNQLHALKDQPAPALVARLHTTAALVGEMIAGEYPLLPHSGVVILSSWQMFLLRRTYPGKPELMS